MATINRDLHIPFDDLLFWMDEEAPLLWAVLVMVAIDTGNVGEA